MRGRTASWSGCRERSCTSTDEWHFVDGTSDVAISFRHHWMGSLTTTISSGRIRATEPKCAPQPRSSGVPSLNRTLRMCDVSTPFRDWTLSRASLSCFLRPGKNRYPGQRLGAWIPVVKASVGSYSVVLSPPILDQHSRLLQREEDLS